MFGIILSLPVNLLGLLGIDDLLPLEYKVSLSLFFFLTFSTIEISFIFVNKSFILSILLKSISFVKSLFVMPLSNIIILDAIVVPALSKVTAGSLILATKLTSLTGLSFLSISFNHLSSLFSIDGPSGIKATIRPLSLKCLSKAFSICSIAVLPPTPKGGFITILLNLFVILKSSKLPLIKEPFILIAALSAKE